MVCHLEELEDRAAQLFPEFFRRLHRSASQHKATRSGLSLADGYKLAKGTPLRLRGRGPAPVLRAGGP
jgi:hypothetical protein